jgi:hypothetical protein
MCLSPRTTPTSLASSLLAGPRRRADGTGSVVARGFAGALSSWTRIGSGITPGTGDWLGSNVGFIAISAAFPSADADHGINGSFGGWPFVAGEETLREDAGRRVAPVLCAKCFRRSGEKACTFILALRATTASSAAQRSRRAPGAASHALATAQPELAAPAQPAKHSPPSVPVAVINTPAAAAAGRPDRQVPGFTAGDERTDLQQHRRREHPPPGSRERVRELLPSAGERPSEHRGRRQGADHGDQPAATAPEAAHPADQLTERSADSRTLRRGDRLATVTGAPTSDRRIRATHPNDATARRTPEHRFSDLAGGTLRGEIEPCYVR